jgi:hypothetical protein
MNSRKAVADAIRRKLNFLVEPPIRDQLLARALQEQEQSWNTEPAFRKPDGRRMIMRLSGTRMERRILAAALICASVVGAAAVGVRYRFVNKDPQRGYLVESEDGHSMMNITEGNASSPEQAVATAEEIARLKQQGQRELVGVVEITVNGQLDRRLFRWKYDLSGGRTITMGEPDPNTHGAGTLTGERLTEAIRLLQETVRNERGPGLFVTTDEGTFQVPDKQEDKKKPSNREQVFQGRTFVFETRTITLSDGTQVAWSSGRLPEDRPARAAQNKPLPDDLREWAALRKQGKGQLVAVDELTVNSQLDRRVFVYRYRLSDGRTMDMRESADGTTRPILSPAQRQQWVQARDAGAGQDLGTYEEQVMGRTFSGTRKKFILSDGTELVWSYGKPKDGQ